MRLAAPFTHQTNTLYVACRSAAEETQKHYIPYVFFFPDSLQREDCLYKIQVLTLVISKYPQRLSTANEEGKVLLMVILTHRL